MSIALNLNVLFVFILWIICDEWHIKTTMFLLEQIFIRTIIAVSGTYLFGTGFEDFGNRGMVVGSLNTKVSLIGPFSLGTELGGRGLSFDP